MNQQGGIVTFTQENGLGRIAYTIDALLMEVISRFQQLTSKFLYKIGFCHNCGGVVEHLLQWLILSLGHLQTHNVASFGLRTEMQNVLIGQRRILFALSLECLTELDVAV